jgi:hypothetical protein
MLLLLHRGFCYTAWTKSRCRVDDAVGQRWRSAVYSTPSVRSQLITSILSLRWLGHLLGTFFKYKTRNQLYELSILRQSGDPAKRARAIVQAVSPQPSAAFSFYH